MRNLRCILAGGLEPARAGACGLTGDARREARALSKRRDAQIHIEPSCIQLQISESDLHAFAHKSLICVLKMHAIPLAGGGARPSTAAPSASKAPAGARRITSAGPARNAAELHAFAGART